MIEVPETLFIDGEALVIDKPAGLDVETPKRGGFSLVSMLGALRFGFRREPSAVHRLDRDTSGCLLLARNPKAHTRFAKAFEEGLVEKVYLGILDGVPEESEGTIALSLSKQSSREKGWRMIAAKKGKAAVTHWRLIDRKDGKALVESGVRFHDLTQAFSKLSETLYRDDCCHMNQTGQTILGDVIGALFVRDLEGWRE